jgi:hypothetical protein
MGATMADTQQPTAKPIAIRPMGMKLDTLPAPRLDTIKSSAKANIMSPVNQNGSFEFDRVIKSGNVVKRTRKTKVGTLVWRCSTV